MTYQEIRASDREFLNSADIAPLIGCDPYALTIAAREQPELLGFPATVIGKRVRFPRRAFLRFLSGDPEPEQGGGD